MTGPEARSCSRASTLAGPRADGKTGGKREMTELVGLPRVAKSPFSAHALLPRTFLRYFPTANKVRRTPHGPFISVSVPRPPRPLEKLQIKGTLGSCLAGWSMLGDGPRSLAGEDGDGSGAKKGK